MNTLYHYAHCPYCIRVRMALKYLNIEFKTLLLNYDDEETPLKLIGKKMLPILVDSSGIARPESLDIIEHFDSADKLQVKSYKKSPTKEEFEAMLTSLSKDVHNLAMPHWIYTKEFNSKSRSYFQKKKEIKRGPFSKLVLNRLEYETRMNTLLSKLSYDFIPFYKSEILTIKDIMIAAQLWGLYSVPEFQFSPHLHSYLQNIKKLTHFNYQEDLWRTL